MHSSTSTRVTSLVPPDIVETHSTVWTDPASAVTTAWFPYGSVVTMWPSTYTSRGAPESAKFTSTRSPVWLYAHSGPIGLPSHADSVRPSRTRWTHFNA